MTKSFYILFATWAITAAAQAQPVLDDQAIEETVAMLRAPEGEYGCLMAWEDCYWDAYVQWMLGNLTAAGRQAAMDKCLLEYDRCRLMQLALELFTP